MNSPELIDNALECARDAIVLLEAAQKIGPDEKSSLLNRACALLHVGSEEARRAKDDLPKKEN